MPSRHPCLLLLCLLLLLPLAHALDAPPQDGWQALPLPVRGLVDDIIATNRVLEPELDADSVRQDFATLVAQLRADIPAGAADVRAAVTALNRRLLQDRQVSYLSRQYWRDSSFVAALQRRRGNCLATSTLYVAAARALDLPIHAVFIPEHAFVCWSDRGRRFNIETTAAGRVVPDLYYLGRFGLDLEVMNFEGWMAAADDSRLLMELQLVAARHLAGQQHYEEATTWYERVVAGSPQRQDLRLEMMRMQADASGERDALISTATTLAEDEAQPKPVRLAALRILADEYAGRLDRAKERAALLQAYGLAQWHERDEIMHQMSTCLRGLRDHAGAALCMELAVAADPTNLSKRAWLAGMLVEADRIDEGLEQIERVRAENPEESYFTNIHAGLLVTAGRREEGRALWETIEAPRTGLETYECNRAWFLAVWGDREEFYPQFEKALAMAKSPGVLSWIAEDDDLDPYREEERFTTIVEACRQRLLGSEAAATVP